MRRRTALDIAQQRKEMGRLRSSLLTEVVCIDEIKKS